MATGDPWYLQAFATLEAHKDGATILVALLSTAIALVATIVGPLVSARIAKKQIAASLETARHQTATALRVARLDFNATVVSTNRQRWIDSLREALAELIALMITVAAHSRANSPDDKEAVANLQRMVELSEKVELYLNPTEADHIAFVGVLMKARSAARSKTLPMGNEPSPLKNPNSLESLIFDLIRRAKEILKAEWERVKIGEQEPESQEDKKRTP